MGEDVEERVRELERERVLKRREKRIKDSELLETVEEVFDRRTVMAIYDLMNRGTIGRMHGAVAAGKEARIYWAETPEGEDVAVKIFLVSTAEFRRGRMKYIEGDPRFKRIRRDMRSLVQLWCTKEYRNLKLAYRAGVRVPRPIDFEENVLVMEFIGVPGERGVPAPLIKDYPPEDPSHAFSVVAKYIEVLYREAELVHADLSEYNILHRDGEYVVIDWGSAVHKDHPNAEEFLLRDIRTIFAYFKRLGVETPDPMEFFRRLAER